MSIDRLRPTLLGLTAVACWGPLVGAQDRLADDLRGHVSTLAADVLNGRETGSSGGLAAAHYIAGVLAAAGCEPAGDDGGWLQKIDTRGHSLAEPPQLELHAADDAPREAAYGTDWIILNGSPVSAAFDLVTVRNEADFPALAAEGGALVLVAQYRDAMGWVRAGHAEGWPLIILVGPPSPGREREAPTHMLGTQAASTMIMVRGELAGGLSSGEWSRATLEMSVADTFPAFNVVGRVPGLGTADRPELADEAIVVTAHYDHITGAAVEPGGDAIYNGADDDASGVAAVLELARSAGREPAAARTLIFLLVTGEEHGLLGTEFYLDHPVVPLEQTVCNLNFEMIGRPDELVGGPGRLWLTGFELSNLGPAWAQAGIPVVADPRPEQNFFRRSDNYAFVKRGVVAQTLSSFNLHGDYHRPSDEADLLDYEHMASCVRVAWRALLTLSLGSLEPAWLEAEAAGPAGH
jgi:hypothetical protein